MKAQNGGAKGGFSRTDGVYACLENTRYTPYLLAKKLGACAVLESASFQRGKERFSLLMCDEAFAVGQDENGVFLRVGGARRAFNFNLQNGGENCADFSSNSCQNRLDEESISGQNSLNSNLNGEFKGEISGNFDGENGTNLPNSNLNDEVAKNRGENHEKIGAKNGANAAHAVHSTDALGRAKEPDILDALELIAAQNAQNPTFAARATTSHANQNPAQNSANSNLSANATTTNATYNNVSNFSQNGGENGAKNPAQSALNSILGANSAQNSTTAQTPTPISAAQNSARNPANQNAQNSAASISAAAHPAQTPAAAHPPKNIPLPACGFGFLGYEFAARCDKVIFAPQKNALSLPESLFVVGHFYLIFDHFTESIHIFGLNYNEHEIDLDAALARLLRRINDMDFSYLQDDETRWECRTLTDDAASKSAYLAKVAALKEHIARGDIIQAVPSRRIQIASNATALGLYGRLRKVNPSPYLVYINFGEFELVAASPESLIRVRSRRAVIHPIAGTTARGENEAQDALRCAQLTANKKERAEHLMLVDLARNDLGRVCKSGSVAVTQYAQCELFSHVIHLVSRVEGELRDGVSAVGALRAAFPAGTVSGAPKISAMQILSGLEGEQRGFYAGAVGYLDINGDLDFCICIRAAHYKDGVFTLQAGGGIVNDSQPEREWDETCEKLGALVSVLS